MSLAGFEGLIREKTKEVNGLFKKLQDLQIQHASLVTLRAQENAAIASRVGEAQDFYKLMYGSL